MKKKNKYLSRRLGQNIVYPIKIDRDRTLIYSGGV